MATMKEVAKLAGVSVATVSRVISSPETVRKTTRDKVEEAIKQLNYKPNYLGRTLRLMKTKRILVLLNTLSNQFFSRVMKGIEDRAREDGYSVLVVVTHGNPDIFHQYAQMLQTHQVDGMIVCSIDVPESDLLKLSAEFPLVCACEPIRSKKIPSVSINDELAAYDAVKFLIRQGKQNIALFGAGKLYYSSVLREKGSIRAMKEASLTPFYISKEGLSYHAGARAVEALLAEKNELPDAIFCYSDTCAIGAISALHRKGFKIPVDVSVMGFDNTAVSEVYIPSITTVAQPQHQIGYQAADLLIRQINGAPDTIKRYELPHEIVFRDSI